MVHPYHRRPGIASASAISIGFLEMPGWCLGRQFQSWVGQVQPVHNLIVLVVGRRVWITGEGIDVGSLQVDHPSALPVEEGVLSWVVEIVSVVLLVCVGDDLPRLCPGPLGLVGFAKPHFAKHRRACELRGY